MSGFHVSARLRVCSSACLVSSWSVVFGSQHSCLEFRLRDGVRTLALHILSLCVSVRAFMLYLVLCGTAACVFHWLRAFMLSCLV